MKTKLFDVTEIIENNRDFVMLRVTGTENELAMTGVFSGNEKRIMVSRARDETITVWKNDGSDYSWALHTSVTDTMRRRRSAITMCLLFGYGMPIQLNGLEWPLAIKGKDTIPNPRARILVRADIGTLFDDYGYAYRNIKAWFGLEGCSEPVRMYRVGDVLDLLGKGASLVPMDEGSWHHAYVEVSPEDGTQGFKCPVCGGTELVNIVHGDVVCPVRNISIVDGDIDYDTSSVDWQKSDVDDLGCECAACHTHFNSVEAALAGNVKQD